MTTPDATTASALGAADDQSTIDAPAVSLPTDTTPSWEIELLISGALTFASYQLPGLLDGWFVAWSPRLPMALSEAGTITYVFAKGIALVLAITFTLHILIRGLWAAALGLHSVYPDGVRWEGVKAGPIFRAFSQAQTLTLPAFVSRLDNAASIVFALGAVLLQVTLIAGVGEVVTLAITAAIRATTGVEIPLIWVFGAVGLLFLVPIFVASTIDKRRGATLAPDSTTARAIRGVARMAGTIGLSRLMGPMMLVFTSRTGEVRGVIGIIIGIYAIFGLVLLQAVVALGAWSPDGYRFLSRRGPGVMLPAYYQDQRDGVVRFESAPFIPSEVIESGWLRVFVPYRIDAFDPAAERQCGGAVAQTRDADTVRARAGRDSVIACVGRLLDVRLDAQPLPPPRWLAGTDASSGLRGLVTYLPLAALAEGPHALSLARLPRRPERAADGKAPAVMDRYEIPFWIDRSGDR